MNKLAIMLLGALSPTLVFGQLVLPETALFATGSSDHNEFGGAVAFNGTLVVVGAPAANAAYVFERQNSAWVQQATLTSGTNAVSGFGRSVGISGETIAVAEAGWFESYKVFVFTRAGGVWNRGAPLSIPNNYGVNESKVAINGDTLLASSVTLPAEGSAYVFVRTGNSWTQQAILLPNVPVGGYFGESVAVEGDTALVGAPSTNKAYVFVRSGGIWSEQAQLNNIGGQSDDRFGRAVAISGDTAVVGAPWRDTAVRQDHGVALVFRRTGTNWAMQATLEPHPADESYSARLYGDPVAISGDTVLVGSPYFYQSVGGEIGSVWSFVRNGVQWDGQELVRSHPHAQAEHFGASAAINGNVAVVGSPGWDQDTLPGKAYVYDGSGICARFNRCDPNVVWVDFNYAGLERGCSDQPYNTLAEGIAAVPGGAALALKPGSKPGATTLSKPMTISACGGTVTLGR
jgi:hypothetical protein